MADTSHDRVMLITGAPWKYGKTSTFFNIVTVHIVLFKLSKAINSLVFIKFSVEMFLEPSKLKNFD